MLGLFVYGRNGSFGLRATKSLCQDVWGYPVWIHVLYVVPFVVLLYIYYRHPYSFIVTGLEETSIRVQTNSDGGHE